jgi:hypothetical protein
MTAYNKLRFIIRTAEDLFDDYNGQWEGDANDFVTASAGSLNEERGEYLTTGDIQYFSDAIKEGEVPDLDWITVDSRDTNWIIIGTENKSELFS